ncbi:hypothetical protein AAEU33_08020 [Chryseobacterium sp. Chry.R1]|uniref:hypothetical protein n=1 Tax=Chryseobacterium sp. Chry.R1 TaxID=3139392 RepID=UPI0031F873E6
MRLLIVLLYASCMLVSCRKSTSAVKIADISDIRAGIEVYQSLSDQTDNMVSIDLYDKKGKQIVNDSINIWVNAKKADYKIVQQLYYSKNYYYRIEKVSPDNSRYNLEIQLPNGKKYNLGSGSALALSNPDNIICNRTASLNKDYFMEWSDLYDVNTLYISKSVQVENKQEPTITTFLEEPSDTITIKPAGSYLIKKEKLRQPHGKLRMLIFKFTATKRGNTNPGLLKGSTFIINGNHQKVVDFK